MSGLLSKVRPLDGPKTGPDENRLAERLACFLRERHPHHAVKTVQQELAAVGEHVGPDTVKNWLSGEKWPSWSTHLESLITAYGQDLVDAVFGPLLLTADQIEERRIARLEAEAAERRARLDRARQHRKDFLHGHA